MMARAAAALLLLLTSLFATASTASAQENTPGKFDFYVLSLSWSPSYCLSKRADEDGPQCAGPRPFHFVVHGLWPQHEAGFPEYCDRKAPRVPEAEIGRMLDIMPSRGLVIHEWRKHGSCTGLTSTAYFDATREARSRVSIPPAYEASDEWRTTTPGEIEAAFRQANPGLGADMIAVTCNDRRLQEVRICMNKGFGFRSCPEVDRRSCRSDKLALPPARASSSR
jgi:ribonuclease T2